MSGARNLEGTAMTQQPPPPSDEELVRLGIQRVSVETFRFGEYSYTHLTDALAAARRAGAK